MIFMCSITQDGGEGHTTITVTAVQHSRVTAVLGAEHKEKRPHNVSAQQGNVCYAISLCEATLNSTLNVMVEY